MSNEFFTIMSIIIASLGFLSVLFLLANIYSKTFSSLVERVVDLDTHLPAKDKDDFLEKEAHRLESLRFPLIIKRCQDVIGSALLLILLIPNFIGLSIAIRVESPGPVFIRKRRIGHNGRTFYRLAFRTEYLPKDNKTYDSTKFLPGTLKEKSRTLTKVGKFLHKTDLEQLPTLFNVLVGDMSFVGRSSFLEKHLTDDLFSSKEKAILLKLKPGLASLWAISPDRVNDDEKWMRKLDLAYAFNWSPWLDLMILSRVLPVALAGGPISNPRPSPSKTEKPG